jgi:predicted dithiol-disulfide oxidoreductase (DUF899 family)
MGEREQHRAPGQRDRRAGRLHRVPAAVQHQRSGIQQGLHLAQRQQPFFAARDQSRRGRVQGARQALHLGSQRRDARLAHRIPGAGQRGARRRGLQAAHGDAGDRQLVRRAQGRRKRGGIDALELALGLVQAADQQQPAHGEAAGVRGVDPVAMRLEHGPRRLEHLRGPGQVARNQRDLGLGDHAARAGQRLLRAECACRPPYQRPGSGEIPQLRHRDAAQRERRRVLAKGDPVQGAERIARRERAGGGRDQGIHRNPAKFVTPSRRRLAANLSHDHPMRVAPATTPPEGERTMASHTTGTRDEWLAARLQLLQAEKEHTRRGDELAQQRQALPWVRIDKPYRFQTEGGGASLADLFQGRSQLLVYHFMFGPDYAAGCPSCSAIADGFDGFAVHLANHDVTLAAVSRAPLDRLLAYRRRMGWSFPWASAHGSDFNEDFNVAFSEAQQREGTVEYNYRRGSHAMDVVPAPEPVVQFAAACGTDASTYARDRPGLSAFVLEDGVVYHTYSTYARGLDGLWGMYQWLDRAPLGRNEAGIWWRRHDEYADTARGVREPCCA